MKILFLLVCILALPFVLVLLLGGRKNAEKLNSSIKNEIQAGKDEVAKLRRMEADEKNEEIKQQKIVKKVNDLQKTIVDRAAEISELTAIPLEEVCRKLLSKFRTCEEELLAKGIGFEIAADMAAYQTIKSKTIDEQINNITCNLKIFDLDEAVEKIKQLKLDGHRLLLAIKWTIPRTDGSEALKFSRAIEALEAQDLAEDEAIRKVLSSIQYKIHK